MRHDKYDLSILWDVFEKKKSNIETNPIRDLKELKNSKTQGLLAQFTIENWN